MNFDLKKIITNEYFQIIIGFIIGIILVTIFIDKNTFWGIFGLIGVFLILLNIIRLINVLTGKKDDLKTLTKNIILAPVIIGLLIGFCAGEFKHLGHLLNRIHLFKLFGLIGLFFSFLISIIRYFKKENRKINFLEIIVSIILFPIVFISIVVFTNRIKANKPIIKTESVVYKKISEIDKTDPYDTKYLILTYIDDEKEKLKTKSEVWNKLQIYDTILVFTKKGNLGYKIVENVEKKPTANTM